MLIEDLNFDVFSSLEPSKLGEDVIKASTNKITGDKGNKYYSEELDKSKGMTFGVLFEQVV